jgi:hypothetical protein
MAETEDADKPTGQLNDKQLLVRIRERCRLMIEGDQDNRDDAKEDICFVSVPGAQWDPLVVKARGSRPCYEFDKLSIKGQRIINEMRANRPSGKVRAAEDTDKKTADVREGLCRNFANVSDLDTICDYAGVYQVEGGMGAWRVTTEYAKTSRKKQRIRAEALPDPFALYWDPASRDPLKRDAADWCLLDSCPKAEWDRRFGKKARKVSFEDMDCAADPEWDDTENIRICEYWYKEPYKKEIWTLRDGKEIDSKSRAAQSIPPEAIVSRETVDCDRIMMCIASGDAIIEGPLPQAGTQHRFVVVHGSWKIVDGKPKWWGVVRKAKDAQRSYNVERTAYVEETLSPNSQFFATADQALGHTDNWDRAITENLPYLLYNADPKAPGPPVRISAAPVPVARVQAMMMADQEMKDVTGVYDASLGERSNETSGRAIRNREQQTQLVNFNFPDNMAKGVQRTWEIFNDLIPEIIDTEQMVRILGQDGSEEYVKVNTVGVDENGMPILVNDLTTGEFDITVTVGPSFATQRQEASETYTNMAQAFPPLMQVAPDLIMKSIDAPYADEIAERMRMLLPPQIQEMLNKDKKLPPEVTQAMQQVKQMQDMVTQQGQMVQAAAAEATQMKTDAEGAEMKVQKAISDLKVQEANFQASVAKEIANIATKQAALATAEANLVKQAAEDQAQGVEEAGQQVEQARQGLEQGQSEAVASIQSMAEQFMQLAANVIAGIDQRTQVQNAPKPRVKMIQRGPNGSLIPVYDQPGPNQVTQIQRQADGSLVPEYGTNGSQSPASLTGTVQ